MFQLGKDTDNKAVLDDGRSMDDGWSMFSTIKVLSMAFVLTYHFTETQTGSSCGSWWSKRTGGLANVGF